LRIEYSINMVQYKYHYTSTRIDSYELHTQNLTSCGKSSANRPSETSCVRTACPKLSTSMEQLTYLLTVVTILLILSDSLQGCSNKSDTCSRDITILLQPCVVNLATFLLYHDCIRRVRTTL
jgi:hypothetical protein